MDINSLDTKSQIFNVALRLFSENGYDKVSIRNISDVVGIKAASIYHHYSSKEEILDACYDFYLEHRYINRLDKKQYEPIIRDGTKEEVFSVLHYIFPESILENMILALFIIFSRKYTDVKAKEIYMCEVDNSMQYLEEFFNLGVKLGRFHEFNITAVSLVILGFRLFIGQSTMIEPGKKTKWQRTEREIYEELPKLIPFKY